MECSNQPAVENAKTEVLTAITGVISQLNGLVPQVVTIGAFNAFLVIQNINLAATVNTLNLQISNLQDQLSACQESARNPKRASDLVLTGEEASKANNIGRQIERITE